MTRPRQTEKRKAEALKQRTIKKMQDRAAQRQVELRRAAGVASKAISKGISSHKKCIPKDIATTISEVKVRSAILRFCACTQEY